MVDERWEEHAAWWIDRFTDDVDPEYTEQLIPLARSELAGATRVLDIGCGEGQISRAAAELGADVIGIDPTSNCLRVARERGGGPSYARAEAAALPFADDSFDAVIVCLVLEHIADVDAAIGEIARVLQPGGTALIFLNHPILQVPGSAWIDDHTVDPPEQYWRLGPYLETSDSLEQVDKGVWIRFVHRPLSTYVNALAERGLAIERMLEPPPPPGFREHGMFDETSAAYPRLLYLRLVASG